jgi:hypothetical protein
MTPTHSCTSLTDSETACHLLQGIYLGFDHLRPFPNERLYTLWTDYNSTNASLFSDNSNVAKRYNTSVWQLGNDFVTAGRWVTQGCI